MNVCIGLPLLEERLVFLPYLQYCFCENPRGFLQLIDLLYFIVQRLIYSFMIKKYMYYNPLYFSLYDVYK